jgi:hypothetical protein
MGWAGEGGDGGLSRLQRAIGTDAVLRDVTVGRALRRVHWMSQDQPADTVVVTHPSTSTEYLIRWEPEPEGRLAILPGGRAREVALRYDQEVGGSESWTPAYRAYHDDFMNGRAHGFITRGTFDADPHVPFFSVWAVERADLHAPGHDDSGEIRTDRRSALSIQMFAGRPVQEVLDWLHQTLGDLARIVTPPLPAALATENAALANWPDRVSRAQSATQDESWLVTEDPAPIAKAVREQIDGERLFLTFPRDRRGRLTAHVRVLLAPAGPGSDLERWLWVIANGPPRAGGHTITLRLQSVIAINELHRFDLAPWLWRLGSTPLTDPSTWGGSVDDIQAIALLRAGKVEEGLRAAGLHLDEALTRMSKGQLLGVIYDEPAWSEEAREHLSLLFPSLLLSAGVAYARRVLRRPSEDGLRLFTLSGQRHARKASVVLVSSHPPALKLSWTGSNRRLPPLLWQRPPIPGAWRAERDSQDSEIRPT